MYAVDVECSELEDTLSKLGCTNTNTSFCMPPSVQTFLGVCADCSDPRPSLMPSQHLESRTKAEKREFDGAQWQTEGDRSSLPCFAGSPAPPLPVFTPPDRVGPNSRWCRRGARTWDSDISVPLTSALDKRRLQTSNLRKQKVSVAVFDSSFSAATIIFLSNSILYWCKLMSSTGSDGIEITCDMHTLCLLIGF